MTGEDIETVLRTQLRKIAPDIDIADIDRKRDLREEFDIDSMDFLNLVTALSKELKLEMPERDYPRMATFESLLAYLQQNSA